MEKAGEDVLIGGVGRPSVGGEDGAVEFAVRVLEPSGIFVIEVGEGALLQFARLVLHSIYCTYDSCDSSLFAYSAFPDSKHAPARTPEFTAYSLVPSPIRDDFRFPKLQIAL